jgi:Dyp-type peroxidase family
MARVDPANVQGLVFQLYRYPLSRNLLFRVANAAAARELLRKWVPRVTHAGVDLTERPEPVINIGVTWTGLAALGVIGSVGTMESAVSAFPEEFRIPPPFNMAGDWDRKFTSTDVHLTFHIYCMNGATLDATSSALRADAAAGLVELAPVETGDHSLTGRALGGGRLHFGFQDGISQPSVKWDDEAAGAGIDFRHFLLGYKPSKVPSSPGTGPWADFVHDGTYGAFQWISQDVAAFEQFLTANAGAIAPTLPLAEAREMLAAKMMGRWRSGTPMVLSPDRADDSLADATEFGYLGDPLGDRCPITAHVRIANRRDQPLTPVVNPTFPDGGPHLLRRGMAYGPELAGEQDDGVDRGLVGMFLCANLRTQFLIVMRWINKTDFSTVFDTDRLRWQDMMMGDRTTSGADTHGAVRTAHGEIVLNNLPAFIKIKGTLFLLIPGMEGLRRIAQEPS